MVPSNAPLLSQLFGVLLLIASLSKFLVGALGTFLFDRLDGVLLLDALFGEILSVPRVACPARSW